MSHELTKRNVLLYRKFKKGVSAIKLAKIYKMSRSRVYIILANVEKRLKREGKIVDGKIIK